MALKCLAENYLWPARLQPCLLPTPSDLNCPPDVRTNCLSLAHVHLIREGPIEHSWYQRRYGTQQGWLPRITKGVIRPFQTPVHQSPDLHDCTSPWCTIHRADLRWPACSQRITARGDAWPSECQTHQCEKLASTAQVIIRWQSTLDVVYPRARNARYALVKTVARRSISRFL